MSTSPSDRFIPPLTLGWRLRMAREATGMGVREFAAHIGVSPDTLTSAEHDARKVRQITLNAYVLATGVDREWLETGEGSPNGPTDPTPPAPKPKADTDALDKLTKSKLAKSRHAGAGSTQRYLPSAA
jgi:transcriptional regulator with XRE-family HTH domain